MNIEEKAKSIQKWLLEKGLHNLVISTRFDKETKYVSDAILEYIETQAVTDLSAENEKLREALSLLVEKIDAPLESPDEWFNDLFDVATEAKQLITEP